MGLEEERVGICFDTCHAYAAGYDLVRDYAKDSGDPEG